MALTRGPKGLYPCPRDLTPHDKLRIDGQEYERRTSEKMLEVINKAKFWAETAKLKTKAKELLKDHSLRPVEVQFIHSH
jgi:hypothetical protein